VGTYNSSITLPSLSGKEEDLVSGSASEFSTLEKEL